MNLSLHPDESLSSSRHAILVGRPQPALTWLRKYVDLPSGRHGLSARLRAPGLVRRPLCCSGRVRGRRPLLRGSQDVPHDLPHVPRALAGPRAAPLRAHRLRGVFTAIEALGVLVLAGLLPRALLLPRQLGPPPRGGTEAGRHVRPSPACLLLLALGGSLLVCGQGCQCDLASLLLPGVPV